MKRQNPDDTRRHRARRAGGDPVATAAALGDWIRLAGYGPPPSSPVLDAALERLSRRLFDQAFSHAAQDLYPHDHERSDSWHERYDEDRLRLMHGPFGYWQLVNRRPPYENGDPVSWYSMTGYPIHEGWDLTLRTPTRDPAVFRGRVELWPCRRPIPWRCAPNERAEHDAHPLADRFPIRQVPVVVLEVLLRDSLARYDLLSWGHGMDSRRLWGLGNLDRLQLYLQEALSELYYGERRPLSGWSFDSPFLLESERGDAPVGRTYWRELEALDFDVVLRIVHPLEPVLIRTHRPDHRGLSLDVEVPNPITALLLDEFVV